MEAKMDANQAKAVKQEEMLAEIRARLDVNTEELKGMINANLKDLKEDIKSSQAGMRSTICGFRAELKETIQHDMKAVIQLIRSELDETTACNEATETEPSPGMMQSIEDHQETPRERPQGCRSEDQGSGVGSAIWPRSTTRK
jgi:hypothetical protein